jgi:hypothetical protein
MKGVYELGGRFLHSKTVRVVHVVLVRESFLLQSLLSNTFTRAAESVLREAEYIPRHVVSLITEKFFDNQ